MRGMREMREMRQTSEISVSPAVQGSEHIRAGSGNLTADEVPPGLTCAIETV